MAAIKPSVPKGTRDFSPAEMVKRNFIFDTIKSVFRKYGYQQIETPSMENLSTLMGKYGDEGDKLIFKILNSGDFLVGINSLKRVLALESLYRQYKAREANNQEPYDASIVDPVRESHNLFERLVLE